MTGSLARSEGSMAFAADPELRARMGAAARASVVPRYAVDRLIDDMDTLYRTLLEERTAR